MTTDLVPNLVPTDPIPEAIPTKRAFLDRFWDIDIFSLEKFEQCASYACLRKWLNYFLHKQRQALGQMSRSMSSKSHQNGLCGFTHMLEQWQYRMKQENELNMFRDQFYELLHVHVVLFDRQHPFGQMATPAPPESLTTAQVTSVALLNGFLKFHFTSFHVLMRLMIDSSLATFQQHLQRYQVQAQVSSVSSASQVSHTSQDSQCSHAFFSLIHSLPIPNHHQLIERHHTMVRKLSNWVCRLGITMWELETMSQECLQNMQRQLHRRVSSRCNFTGSNSIDGQSKNHYLHLIQMVERILKYKFKQPVGVGLIITQDQEQVYLSVLQSVGNWTQLTLDQVLHDPRFAKFWFYGERYAYRSRPWLWTRLMEEQPDVVLVRLKTAFALDLLDSDLQHAYSQPLQICACSKHELDCLFDSQTLHRLTCYRQHYRLFVPPNEWEYVHSKLEHLMNALSLAKNPSNLSIIPLHHIWYEESRLVKRMFPYYLNWMCFLVWNNHHPYDLASLFNSESTQLSDFFLPVNLHTLQLEST